MRVSSSICLTTLSNGFRVVTDEIPYVDSAVVAVGVKAGSRNETSENNGIAHFLEHMAFKGTISRTAKQISDAIENVGGYMNAATSKEKTVYYIKVLKEDVSLAIDILADILQNSTFDENEISKEKTVILQELASSLDTPSDFVFDIFGEQAFGSDCPLGRTILGKKKNINSMSRNDIISFIDKYYFASNMVFAASGNIKHDDIVKIVDGKFLSFSAEKSLHLVESPYRGGGVNFRHKSGLSQMQFVLGFGSCSYTEHGLYHKVGAVCEILGGGMSSRLFQIIREELGLAYSIAAYRESYCDTGIFAVYSDSSVDNLLKLLDGVKSVISSVITSVDEIELSRVLHQYKASILMKQESVSDRAMKLVSNYLMFDRYIDSTEIMEPLSKLTPKDISSIMEWVIMNSGEPLTLSLYGSFGKKDADIMKEVYGLVKSDFLNGTRRLF